MRVLVTAASKHGSTEEIGARIGSVIGDRGHAVDVRCPTEVQDVERYDVIVLGSAVYAGHWQKEARELVTREQEVLAHRPVWLFSSGPVGNPPLPEELPTDGEDIRAAIGALEHHLFTGKLDRSELSLPERAVVRALHVAEGDYRDWDDVDRWAATIAASISSG
jgi:menaquinone-dependent protoporphyrinogen oxidase